METMIRKCHFCARKCTALDWCYGCKVYVCRLCDHPTPDDRPFGNHKPEAHRAHVVPS